MDKKHLDSSEDKEGVVVTKKVVTTVTTTEEVTVNDDKLKKVKDKKATLKKAKSKKSASNDKSESVVDEVSNDEQKPSKKPKKTKKHEATQTDSENKEDSKPKKLKFKRIYIVSYKDKKTGEFGGFKLKKSFYSPELLLANEQEVEDFINKVNVELMVFVHGRNHRWARVYTIYKKDEELIKDVKVIDQANPIHHLVKEFNPELDTVKVKKPVMFMLGMLSIVIALIVLFIMIGLFIWGKAGF